MTSYNPTAVAAISEILTGKLLILPAEQQQQVFDFIDFLLQKYSQPQPQKQRVLGLSKGKIWMSDDFNAPLPDEFWLGEV
ncbi:MAG: DUF2281 domain-containing protein [Acaryochloris sp. CRU_2_0]|nr:DUF2281 domain-containing protein [Acaryochloris sp. CRU_2_0]